MTNETPMSENAWPARREQLERLYGVSKAILDSIETIISHARHMALEEAMEVVATEQKSEHDRYYNAERTSMLKHNDEAAQEIRIERDAVLSTYAHILEALKNMK